MAIEKRPVRSARTPEPSLPEPAPGVIDKAAQIYFTHGQCHALALALHEATGWPLVIEFTQLRQGRDIRHALVQMPSGKLVDINTAFYGKTRVGLLTNRATTTEQHFARLIKQGVFPAPNMELARSMVPAILATVRKTA